MILLTLELSPPIRSVAVVATQPKVCVLSSVSDAGVKERRPLSLAAEALQVAATPRDRIEGIVIGLGPGSYTGIRSAIALAQGWELARQILVLGIGSAECIAAGAQQRGWFGRTTVAIDAQRNELYIAEYDITPTGFTLLKPLRLITVAEAKQVHDAKVIGPEVTRWFENGKTLVPEASVLGQLAAGRNDWCRADALEPIYLRPTSFVKAPPPRTIPAHANARAC